MCDLVGIENNLSLNYVQGFLISTTIITLKYLLAQPTDKKKLVVLLLLYIYFWVKHLLQSRNLM